MTRAAENFLIHGYRVAPAELAIYGPHGRQIISADAMTILIELAGQSEHNVSGADLLQCLGDGLAHHPGQIEKLISELRESFDDHVGKPLFIVGTMDDGYRLATPALPLEPGNGDDKDTGIKEKRTGHSADNTISGQPEHAGQAATAQLQTETTTTRARPQGLFESLKRRRVFRVLGSYAVASWLIMQITDVLSGAFPVPDWTPAAVAIALAVGFPVVAVLAWVFQLTPHGMEWDSKPGVPVIADRARFVHFLDLVVIGVLLVAVALLSYGKFFPTLPFDSKTKIAVMPFQDLTESGDGRYLSEGISDDIRTRLYEVPQFLVAARASTNALSNKGLDIKTIGERLTVSHVLDGSIRRVGNQLRVAVQLVDVSTGFNYWSKSYNTRIRDILEMQSNISLFVASELKVLLTKEVREALAENPTENPAAYDLYLQARSFLNRPKTAGNLDNALVLFRQALDQDPGFAQAYAGLCHTFIARYFGTNDTAFIAAAETNCDQALKLDANLAEVHAALGELYLSVGRLDQARASYQSALALDAKSIEAYAGLAKVFNAQGDYEAAETQYRGAIDLLPGYWNGYNLLAQFLLRRGRYEEAAENFQRVIAFTPDNAHAYNNLGATYYLLGRFDQAADYYSRSLELEPGRAAYSNTGTMHYYSGDYQQAAAMFKKAAEEAGSDYRLWGNLADAQRFLPGASDLARQTYGKAIRLARAQLDVNPLDQSALINLAFYYANLGEAKQAGELLQQAGQKSRQNPEHEYMKALSYALLDQPEQASRSRALAISLGFPQTIIDVTPELQELALVETQADN
ncbi:MAG: tetratricopeptide repeat protein [Gammaproteobacteria bacterium]|nr:tetratricopeptide repeat protein [Gammaproteobacteria bacterium]